MFHTSSSCVRLIFILLIRSVVSAVHYIFARGFTIAIVFRRYERASSQIMLERRSRLTATAVLHMLASHGLSCQVPLLDKIKI